MIIKKHNHGLNEEKVKKRELRRKAHRLLAGRLDADFSILTPYAIRYHKTDRGIKR
jgi:hypothetical protein